MNDNKQNQIQTIPLGKLVEHPDNPNKMSAAKFARLVSNIERTGRYEPVIVRQHNHYYQIINGHHRVKALRQLGQKTADCLIWDVDDHEARILLATLNRLGGTDVLDKKIALLKQLNKVMHAKDLSNFLPESAKQLERLANLRLPKMRMITKQPNFLRAMAFFVRNEQHKIIRRALDLAEVTAADKIQMTKAQRNAAALTRMAESFIEANENFEAC
ncbi:MAG: ParB N-terminal domain-containing protein [Sedimentisphaerales bacterium]|nr:ParB N-terminal domain-containing protein [Sedimentisphaerales bacterium]